MATVFPTSLDTFTTKVNGVDDVLAADTNNLQDAVSALQAKVGTNGSSVGTSLDKRIAQLEQLAAQVVGIEQTWQDVSASRTWATTYQNTTGRAIQVSVRGRSNTTNARYLQVSANGTTWVNVGMFPGSTADSNIRGGGDVVVPNGWYYRVDDTLGTLNVWSELR